MIGDEATGRFPEGAVPRLVLLQYGDHPVIEPGELYLQVILGQDGATRDGATHGWKNPPAQLAPSFLQATPDGT